MKSDISSAKYLKQDACLRRSQSELPIRIDGYSAFGWVNINWEGKDIKFY